MKFPNIKYNRVQQRVIVVLGFVLLVVVLIFTYPSEDGVVRHALSSQDSALIAEVEAFETKLVEKEIYDSIRQSEWKNRYQKSYPIKKEIVAQTFEFDPNTVDSATFVKLGFRPHIARSIMRYRAKGGRFDEAKDLMKIYYIDTVRVRELLAYIKISPVVGDTIQRELDKPKVGLDSVPLIVNLNVADTVELQKLPYIAAYRAKQIVYYRNRLGGFYALSQLSEACDNITLEQMDALAQYVVVDGDDIRRIPVNKSSLERLRSHPYINFYQARAIYELRWENDGVLTSIEQLSGLKELTPNDLGRLVWYLSFE